LKKNEKKFGKYDEINEIERKERKTSLIVIITCILILSISGFLSFKFFLENYDNRKRNIKYAGHLSGHMTSLTEIQPLWAESP